MSFYKYTTISTASLVLQNQSLRWSSPLLFNDLEECQFTPFTENQYLNAYSDYINILKECAEGHSRYDSRKFTDINQTIIQFMKLAIQRGTFDDDGLASSLLNMSTQFGPNFYREYINTALIRTFRILCVTGRYDNSLMWSYYANEHYGCVIELKQVYVDEPRLLRQGHIRYHENLEPLSNPIDMLLYGETKEVRDLMIKDVIFSKGQKWNHEEEYRFLFSETWGQITTTINMQTNEKNIKVADQPEDLFTDVSVPKESIKSITFGARTNSEDMEKILHVISEKNYEIDLYQMKLINGKLTRETLVFSE